MIRPTDEDLLVHVERVQIRAGDHQIATVLIDHLVTMEGQEYRTVVCPFSDKQLVVKDRQDAQQKIELNYFRLMGDHWEWVAIWSPDRPELVFFKDVLVSSMQYDRWTDRYCANHSYRNPVHPMSGELLVGKCLRPLKWMKLGAVKLAKIEALQEVLRVARKELDELEGWVE